MKKLLTFLLMVVALGAMAQNGTVFQVEDSTTAFGRTLKAGKLVQDEQTGTIYQMLNKAASSQKLSNSDWKIVNRDSTFVNYCDGCTMESGWKLLNDTIYIDTTATSGGDVYSSDTTDWLGTYWMIVKLDTARFMSWQDTNSIMATQAWVNLQGFLTSYTETDPVWLSDSNEYYTKLFMQALLGLKQDIQDTGTWDASRWYVDSLLANFSGGVSETYVSQSVDSVRTETEDSLQANREYMNDNFISQTGSVNQVAVLDGTGQIEGSDNFTYDGVNVNMKSTLTVNTDSTTGFALKNGAGTANKFQLFSDGGMLSNYISTNKGQGTLTFGIAAGQNLTSDVRSVLIGRYAGNNQTTQLDNTYIGYNGGINSTGGGNTFVGSFGGSGVTTGGSNTLIGANAGSNVLTGNNIVALGYEAAVNNRGDYGIGIGYRALYGTATGSTGTDNIGIGQFTGERLQTGSSNVLVGTIAGRYITSGIGNTALGRFTAFTQTTGNYNLYLGMAAGSQYGVPGENYKLYVSAYTGSGNNEHNLVHGDFLTKQLGVNTRTLTATLNAKGSGNTDATTGFYVENSDGSHSTSIKNGGTMEHSGDIKQKVYTDDVSNPPTDAELDAIYGTPATVGAGYTSYIDDNGGGTNFYQIISDGTNWFILTGTKAL